MTLPQVLMTLVCVLAISGGQLLFKQASLAIEQAGTWQSQHVLFLVGLAFFVYGLTTLLWINVLRHIPLSRAHIFMSLSFVLVPVASHFLYGDLLSKGFIAGLSLVVLGLIVAIQYG
ncbi:EamA family transporter [Pseudomonas nitroreducens]|uniref:EamA family transporter n=1 Tax=Pseudomonas nitroreducens TaxID=46680 RepID=UPI0028B171CA|nr:EamA family transporter [Pseudomonas nitroreducens]